MNLATVQFYAPSLGRHVSYAALLPSGKVWDEGQQFPLLYQLHGKSDDHTAWLNFSNLAVHAREFPFIIVMPNGAVSFWSNYSARERYETFLIQDLDTHVRKMFPVRPGKAAIGGLSMGGYGAMALALKYPERFASVWSHSSAFYDASEFTKAPVPPDDPSALDIFSIAEKAKSSEELPSIGFDCGRDDFLIEWNRRFHAHLDQLGIEHLYREHDGAHTWEYWDLHVREALRHHEKVLMMDGS